MTRSSFSQWKHDLAAAKICLMARFQRLNRFLRVQSSGISMLFRLPTK